MIVVAIQRFNCSYDDRSGYRSAGENLRSRFWERTGLVNSLEIDNDGNHGGEVTHETFMRP